MTAKAKTVRYTGRMAARGCVTGKPVIVKDETELGRVGVGDILVAAQTDIAFVPAMLRAAAIITECGGRFCHAAVWARENQKPTLLQVTDATTNLRDVDEVLVNADDQYVEIVRKP